MDLTVEIYGGIRTLEEALGRFTSTEILEGENKYFCNRCESYERTKKKLMILEAPNILTIAWKRYQFGNFGKINKTVKFPEYLNLAPYMKGTEDKSPVYGLYAVVVHLDFMNASFSGHYVCYVKNARGKWYEINDSVVNPVELQKVLTKDAYMLFYARCSPQDPNSLRKAMSQNHGNIKNNYNEAPPTHVEESPMRRPRSVSMSSLNSSKNYSNRFLPLQSDNGLDDFNSGASFDKRSHNSRPNFFGETTRDSFRTSDHSDIKRSSPSRFSKDRQS